MPKTPPSSPSRNAGPQPYELSLPQQTIFNLYGVRVSKEDAIAIAHYHKEHETLSYKMEDVNAQIQILDRQIASLNPALYPSRPPSDATSVFTQDPATAIPLHKRLIQKQTALYTQLFPMHLELNSLTEGVNRIFNRYQ